jgi:glycosyltransferase involved in cell wall biosynthesis
MKVFIASKLTNEPTGGGNQFLRLLKRKFINVNLYTETPSQADVILFNSHQHTREILFLKQKLLDKLFVHRVDGPMRLYNTMEDARDDIVYYMNNQAANATVFQTEWSMKRNIELGLSLDKPYAVIGNASDEEIFYKPESENKADKIIIISTSWSSNINKGFDYYKFLDENLDFDKFEYWFAGRSPLTFKNIKMLGSLTSQELANHLRRSNLYITASKNDPCSNSLIEAISCGRPVLALNSGGHPEIIKDKAFLFDSKEELIEKISSLREELFTTTSQILIPNSDEVALKYINFFKKSLIMKSGTNRNEIRG